MKKIEYNSSLNSEWNFNDDESRIKDKKKFYFSSIARSIRISDDLFLHFMKNREIIVINNKQFFANIISRKVC